LPLNKIHKKYKKRKFENFLFLYFLEFRFGNDECD
jgi:hypothetical protein